MDVMEQVVFDEEEGIDNQMALLEALSNVDQLHERKMTSDEVNHLAKTLHDARMLLGYLHNSIVRISRRPDIDVKLLGYEAEEAEAEAKAVEEAEAKARSGGVDPNRFHIKKRINKRINKKAYRYK
jgi:hypothetical protein